MFVAEKLANFVHGLRYEELPPDAVAAARRYLADSFAAPSPPTTPSRWPRRASTRSPAAAPPTPPLSAPPTRPPADVAALVNGTMVRYLDANDIFAPTPGREGGHFSDVIPALAALAEARGHDANELVTAVVANYELLGALSETYHFSRRGYHAITVEPWTLALVASRLLRAGPDAAVHACGLAGATGMVLNTWLRPSPSIPMIKAVAVGLASPARGAVGGVGRARRHRIRGRPGDHLRASRAASTTRPQTSPGSTNSASVGPPRATS